MRYGSYRHKETPHYPIAMPPARRDAIARVASRLGVSRHVVIQKFIDLGLSVYGEDE